MLVFQHKKELREVFSRLDFAVMNKIDMLHMSTPLSKKNVSHKSWPPPMEKK